MNARDHEPQTQVLRVDCDAVVDPVEGTIGCCLLAERVDNLSLSWRVLAVGTAEEVGRHPAAGYAEACGGRGTVVVPGLVNAHTHLDLTHMGPRRHDPGEGFVAWVDMIRRERRRDEEGIAESVRRGAELCLAGGCVAVGDIAGSPQGNYTLAPWRAVRETALGGVTFIEGFGIGKNWQHLRAGLEEFVQRHAQEFGEAAGERLRLGLQPHAPNTVELPHYLWYITLAERLGAPLTTHLAETVEEREFVGRGAGAQRELLERLGVWDDSILEHVGRGLHPVTHMEPVLSRAKFVAAHCNDATDEAIEVLARTGTSVAYCPRASEYFGAAEHFGAHRYRDMLRAGVDVCLGTDSIVNLPAEAAEGSRGGISVLHEMRRLYTRDGTPAADLLRMATVNGARALGLDEERWRVRPGRVVAGLLLIQLIASPSERGPLESALASGGTHRLLR